MNAQAAIDMTRCADREIVVVRTFDAPRDLVWRAWTDVRQIVQWWGPGGSRVIFDEAVEPERLVYVHGGEEDVDAATFQTIVLFEKQRANPHKTRLTLRMVFPSAEERDRTIREQGAIEKGIQTVGRLAEHLARMSGRDRAAPALVMPSERAIVLTRVFDAPRSLVFDAFTRPELLRRWAYGPAEWPLPVCGIDLRVGGALIYAWRQTDAGGMHVRSIDREIVPPERLVRTDLFDEDWTGGETLVTIAMVERKGRTTVTSAVLHSSQEARDAVLETPMAQSLAGCYDSLADLLAATAA